MSTQYYVSHLCLVTVLGFIYEIVLSIIISVLASAADFIRSFANKTCKPASKQCLSRESGVLDREINEEALNALRIFVLTLLSIASSYYFLDGGGVILSILWVALLSRLIPWLTRKAGIVRINLFVSRLLMAVLNIVSAPLYVVVSFLCRLSKKMFGFAVKMARISKRGMIIRRKNTKPNGKQARFMHK